MCIDFYYKRIFSDRYDKGQKGCEIKLILDFLAVNKTVLSTLDFTTTK